MFGIQCYKAWEISIFTQIIIICSAEISLFRLRQEYPHHPVEPLVWWYYMFQVTKHHHKQQNHHHVIPPANRLVVLHGTSSWQRPSPHHFGYTWSSFSWLSTGLCPSCNFSTWSEKTSGRCLSTTSPPSPSSASRGPATSPGLNLADQWSVMIN